MSALANAVAPALAPTLWRDAGGAVAVKLAAESDADVLGAGVHYSRWHFQHGPIDLMIAADGTPDALDAASQAAWQGFTGLLAALVDALPMLRQPILPHAPLRVPPFQPCTDLPSAHDRPGVQGAVAQRMLAACLPYAQHIYITPMAAVAGAVADTVIQAFARQPGIRRAFVNNGGDIALHLTQGTQYRVGLYDMGREDRPALDTDALFANDLDGTFTVSAASSVRGIATSGWRGRSFSLGIADSVSVLAACSAQADAAATVIANQVDADHTAIHRAPANTLKDDSDLGDALVTTQVGRLPEALVQHALARGEHQARALLAAGLIEGAALLLQGQRRVVWAEQWTKPAVQEQEPRQAAVSANAGMLSFA